MAIFEFSSSNGFSSFNMNFQCRNIGITEIGDENYNHFSYFFYLPYDLWNETSCDELGYEEWETDLGDTNCIATFPGKKCSYDIKHFNFYPF